jgi:hypothetical protein
MPGKSASSLAGSKDGSEVKSYMPPQAGQRYGTPLSGKGRWQFVQIKSSMLY